LVKTRKYVFTGFPIEEKAHGDAENALQCYGQNNCPKSIKFKWKKVGPLSFYPFHMAHIKEMWGFLGKVGSGYIVGLQGKNSRFARLTTTTIIGANSSPTMKLQTLKKCFSLETVKVRCVLCFCTSFGSGSIARILSQPV